MSTPILPPYVAPYKPVPQVTPFTYRDGVTMLEKVKGIVKYINKVIIPFINTEYSELADAFETQVNLLIAQVNSAIGDLDGQSVEEAIDALTAYVDNAVQTILDNSLEVNDPMVAAMFANSESATRGEADTIYAPISTVDSIDNLETDLTTTNNTIRKNTQRVVNLGELEGAAGDGITDNTAIFQAAFDTVGNGVDEPTAFYLPPGVWLTDTLRFKSNTIIYGLTHGTMGLDSYLGLRTTVIKLKDNANAPAITDYSDEALALAAGVVIKDIVFDGNKANQSVEAPLIQLFDAPSGQDPKWIIERCSIRSANGPGIQIGAFRRAIRILDCEILDCEDSGIIVGATDCTITSCLIGRNGKHGIEINAGLQHIHGNDIWGQAENGVNIISSAHSVMLTNCGIDGNGRDGVYSEAPMTQIVATTFQSNGQEANATYSHINFGFPTLTAQGSTVVGCAMRHDSALANKALYGISANIAVSVIGLSYNPDSVPWTGGMAPNAGLAVLAMREQGLRDGAYIQMGTPSGAGIKLGTLATQKLGFWGATPVVRPTVLAAATDATTTQALVNDLRSKLVAIGLVQ